MFLPLAFVVVACWVIARDVTELSSGAALYLVGAVCLVACAATGIDLVNRALAQRLPRRWALAVLLFALALLPLGFALSRYFEVADTLSWRTPLSISLFGVALLLVTYWLSRRASDSALLLASCWALVLALLFIQTHLETGTLSSVREGTELLHLGLYLGTWSVLLPATLGAGFREQALESKHWLRVVLGLAQCLLGLLLLEADRRLFVDLYTAVHLWFGVMGILLFGLGLAPLLTLLFAARRWQFSRAKLAPLFVVAAIAVAFTLLGPALGSPSLRASLSRSPLGLSVLELLPVSNSAKSNEPAHPALAYSQHLDAPEPSQKFNILLLTVDALRADALAGMKEVGRVSEEATVFTHAYAQGARTAIGTGTLMTGRYSANMDWGLWIYSKGIISEYSKLSVQERQVAKQRFVFTTVPTVPRGNLLAERLNNRGYATLAVPFAGKNEFFRDDLVFARGFDRFVDLTAEKWKAPTSRRVVDRSLKELKAVKGRPWFLWTHLYDPHESARDKKKYNRYVSIVDAEIGRLLQAVRDSGEWDKTVVVLLADHGEAFGEHRHNGHASSLYEEQVRVPFLLRVPGIAAQQIDEPVAAIDATATLAVLAGAKTNDLDGVNLLPRMRGEVSPEARPVFTELHRYMSSKTELTTDLKAVVYGDYKLINNRRRKTQELFNLESDPKELRNLLDAEPGKQQELAAILDSFLRIAEAAHPLP